MRIVEPIREPEKIEEVKRILRKESYRNWFMFVMGINTGMRISDLLKLKVEHVRGKSHIRVIEQKNKNPKVFKINGNLREEIDAYTYDMQNDDYLFPSRLGVEPIQRVQAYKILNRAARKAGLESIGTHTCRKTFGYHFYKMYKDVVILQRIFGHAAPSITLRYIGIAQDEMDEKIDGFHL